MLAVCALSLPAAAKEAEPVEAPATAGETGEIGGTGGAKTWLNRCQADAKLSLEGATKFCQCLWDQLGPENVPFLADLEKIHPEAVAACTTSGPKAWIPKCITDSKLAQKPGQKFCQCIWDKIGPENVPDLGMLAKMDPKTLAACKKK